MWLGGFLGGLDSLGIVGLAVDVFREVRTGQNMSFEVFDTLQGFPRWFGRLGHRWTGG